jgi:hypothetical protein
MKTLKNQTLLYDTDCPLCNLYTTGFIKAKMLDKNGKKPFVSLTKEEQNCIDINRAKNEIALVNTQDNTVLYGIDGLLRILGHSFPLIEKVGHFTPVNYFLKKVYKLISFNRKVIIPSKELAAGQLQCVPEFNTKYRGIYIFLTVVFTATTLHQYAQELPFFAKNNFVAELFLALGQIGFQWFFIQKLDNQKKLHYIGNLMTVSVIGCLALLPMLVCNTYFGCQKQMLYAWFCITATGMFFEHYRRIKILAYPKHLSISWILYRALALIAILFVL